MTGRTVPRAIAAALICATAIAAGAKIAAADTIIGVSDAAPVHFHIARALCRALRAGGVDANCRAQRVEGGHAAAPIAILSDVCNNTIEIGITQSDWVHHAVRNSGPLEFLDLAFDNLRTLFVLHGEPFTIIARRDARIATLDDLEGKRVNIGRSGSNRRLVMEQVMQAKGWNRRSFQVADELTGPEQSLALCHNRIQAMVAPRWPIPTASWPRPSTFAAPKSSKWRGPRSTNW